jgi:hypothetical protein
MEIYTNCDILPLNVNQFPWLYEKSVKNKFEISELVVETKDDVFEKIKNIGVGKWMLFYPKILLNEKWEHAKQLYRNNKLKDIFAMKCSTNYVNPRAPNSEEGIIILYCSDSYNEEKIMNIGKTILQFFDYNERKIIYYKTDFQTIKGTVATGSNINYTYKLINPLYKTKYPFIK